MLNGYVYVILVQRREELAIMSLATIPANEKKNDAIASVLARRMDITIVQRREELAIMPLATIPANVKKNDAIVSVLDSRMDIIITTLWQKKLRPRDLIWSVLQSPIPKRHRSRRTCQGKTFTNLKLLLVK